MESISSHHGNEENKPSSLEKNTKNNKGILRMDIEKKDKDPTDIASMKRVIKQLMNDIIDLKKNKGEGKKLFNPFMKKRTNYVPQIPPTSGINIEYYTMDNFCRTHHANHFERTCSEFINSFTTMLTPPEPPIREKRNEMRKKKKINKRKRKKKDKNLHPTEILYGMRKSSEMTRMMILWKKHVSVMTTIFNVRELQRRMIHPLLLRQTTRIPISNKHQLTSLLIRRKRRRMQKKKTRKEK